MKERNGSKRILFLWIFIEIIYFKLSENQKITSIDPNYIKINSKTLGEEKYLTLIFDKEIENRENSIVMLEEFDCSSNCINNISFSYADGDHQYTDKKKITYKIELNSLVDKYRKYKLYFCKDSSCSNRIESSETLLVYLNDIILKIPKNKYFLRDVSQGNQRIATFKFENEIFKNEINKIEYYEYFSSSNAIILDPSYYTINGDEISITLLSGNFDFTNPRKYIFNIYPEYDPNSSNPETQMLKIMFYDYLLMNDAIFVSKARTSTTVLMMVISKSKLNSIVIREREGGGESHQCNFLDKYSQYNYSENGVSASVLNYNCTFEITKKTVPDTFVAYYSNVQDREVYLILYESGMDYCYFYDDSKELLLYLSWLITMKYDINIYFDDINHKELGKTLNKTIDNIMVYNYKLAMKNLKAGVFSLYGMIPDLSQYHIPVDSDNLKIYIYNKIDSSEGDTTILYSNNKTDQNLKLEFNSDSIDSLDFLDEIILKKIDSNFKISVSKKEGQCSLNKNIYSCNLKDTIYGYLSLSYLGLYDVYYKSQCDTEFQAGKKVEIRKGYDLISITPNWINKNNVIGIELILEYNVDLDNVSEMSIYPHQESEECKDKYTPEKIANKKIKITLNKGLDEGIYYIITTVNKNTSPSNFTNKVVKFKVGTPGNFTFNHHYFILDETNQNNALIINSENVDNFNGTIIEQKNETNKLEELTEKAKYKYKIVKTGTICFDYYDKDNFLVPINDCITVVNIYKRIFSIKEGERDCYYYNFSITLNLGTTYPDVILALSLFNLNESKNFSFINNSNTYSIDLSNEGNDSFLNFEYYLLISESYIDKEVYLFKKSVKLTDLTSPDYIFNPNTSIYFSNVKCNLSQTKITIQKIGDTNQRTLSSCNLIGNQLNCPMGAGFYSGSSIYGNNIFQVDGKEVKKFNNNTAQNTFISNKLSDSRFTISYSEEGENIIVTFTNANKDFYFPKLRFLEIFTIIGGVNKSVIYDKNDKRDPIKFHVNEDNYTATLNNTFGLINTLIINYLKREIDGWESENDPTIYHYFNETIEIKLFEVSPRVFAFNNKTEEDFKVNIIFKSSETLFKKDLKNLIDCDQEENPKTCFIDSNLITDREAQNITISINGKDNSKYDTYFIYYGLNDSSLKCFTLGDETEYFLVIKTPVESFINDMKLLLNSWKELTPEIKGRELTYILRANETFPDDSFIINLDTYNFYDDFYLEDIGVDILPKYKIELSYKDNIYLLPEENQNLNVEISTENYYGVDIDDIVKFKLKNKNDNKIEFESKSLEKNDPQIKITFSLKNAANYESKEYYLFYINKCNQEINSSIIININYFTFERKFFVLNNNKNEEIGQNLIVNGPGSSNSILYVYKDDKINEEIRFENGKYTIHFGSGSEGIYSFEYSLDNGETASNIQDKVYVFKNLEDLFTVTNSPSNCYFLDQNKNAFQQINFDIKGKNESIVNDISLFKSKFTNDNRIFPELEKTFKDTNKKTLNFIFSDKNKIDIGRESFIYLIENNDIDQPIYVYKFNYTDIKLNKRFQNVIYTDALYITFDMSCEIKNVDKFLLIKGENEKNLICENESKFEKLNSTYKCYLSQNNPDNNPFLNFGKTNFDYGNYSIKYTGTYETSNNQFFLSQAISSADFFFEPEEQIDPNQYTTFKFKSFNKAFYLPDIEKASYMSTYSSSTCSADNLQELKPNNFNFDYSDFSKNYVTFSLYIERGWKYCIRKICRNICEYCSLDNCKNFDNYYIESNALSLKFNLNKHYIALNESRIDTQLVDYNKIILDIEDADTGYYDRDKINKVYYSYTDENFNNKEVEMTSNLSNPYKYELKLINPGKYTFKYETEINGKTNKFDVINQVVIVAYHDYEIFNYTELTKSCAYYDDEKGLLVSINPNDSCKFKDDVKVSFMNLKLNEYLLSKEEENGYDMFSDTKKNFKYYTGEFEVQIVEGTFIFAKLENKLNLTQFNIQLYNSSYFYYKDNIVTTQQDCKIDNINIKISDKESSSKITDNNYYLLQCDYESDEEKSYCSTNHIFDSTYSKLFDIYIGYKFLYKLSKTILVYNSIIDSDYSPMIGDSEVGISSNNFDLSKINLIKVNENDIEKFLSKTNNSLTFSNNYLDNSTNYLKLVQREDHPDDRNITIKQKILEIEIAECGKYTVYYKGICITCEQNAIFNTNNKKYYQNKMCVSSCSGEYYKLDKNGFICEHCEEVTKDGEEYICGCQIGTVKSIKNQGICYLPEDEEIKNELNERPNIQCYRADGETHNFCNPSGTEICITNKMFGYDLPECICKNGYTGKYCEFKDEVDLNIYLDKIKKENPNKIEETSPSTIAYIRGIIFFLEKDEGYDYMNSLHRTNKAFINYYINGSLLTMNSAIIRNTAKTPIFDILELCLYFLYYETQIQKNNNNLRRLEEYNEDLDEILNKAHLINCLANKNLDGDYNIQADNLNLMSFISYKESVINSTYFKSYVGNESYSRLLGYTFLNEKGIMHATSINRKLFRKNTQTGVMTYISSSNDEVNKKLLNTKNFNYFIYSSETNFNPDLASYYINKGIDIYQKTDPAFQERCFHTDKFDYDLTQTYRKKYLFQKVSLSNEKCNYQGFDVSAKKIIFNCSGFLESGEYEDKNGNINFGVLYFDTNYDFIENENKTYNLPLRCSKKIQKIYENYGFWIYFIVLFIEICYCIGITVLTTGSLRHVAERKGLYNDDLFYGPPIVESNIIKEKEGSKSMALTPKKKFENTSRINFGNDNGYKRKTRDYSLIDCLINNFKELHPIASLCKVSIITPLIINSWFFTFNTLNLLGFNALIYLESIIEKRIYDKNRDNFAYPMRKEFGKIILSILLEVCFAFIFRFITLIKLSQRNELLQEFNQCKTLNEQHSIVNRFERKNFLKRIITGICMLAITIFLFCYTVVFCGVYVKTQRNLFFSFIWSLFWNWIIFAPIYIVVIAIMESQKKDANHPLIYNMKKLFVF